MSTVKISELSSSANITSDDFFPVVDSLVTKKATAELMKNFVLGKSGSNDSVHISSSDAIKLSATGGLDILGDTTITGSLATDSNTMEFDGAADISGSLVLTGSFLTNASQLDFDGNMTITGSLTISGSSTFTNIGPAVFNGPISTTHPITGSISGSVNNAVSSSFAISSSRSTTSSFATTAAAATSITFIPSTASYAVTASYALNGGGGALTSNTTFLNIAGMTPTQTVVGTITDFGKSFILFSATTNTDIRVRLYGSASYRSNDLARPIGTNPPQNSGIITDLALSGSPALFDFTLSPVAIGTNRDPIKTPTIYYTVTNLSDTTTDVSMSFNRLVLE